MVDTFNLRIWLDIYRGLAWSKGQRPCMLYHHVNRMNSRNGSAMMLAVSTINIVQVIIITPHSYNVAK